MTEEKAAPRPKTQPPYEPPAVVVLGTFAELTAGGIGGVGGSGATGPTGPTDARGPSDLRGPSGPAGPAGA